MMKQRNEGFSLVELAVVLGIIGLLTGGILVANNLIQSSKLRQIPAEYQRYTAAVLQFADQYRALPGDMATATTMWGQVSAAAGCVAPSATVTGNNIGVGTGKLTCNGTGDDAIGPYNTANSRHEMFRAWQHLANAGLISGTYTGYKGSTGANHLDHVAGSNCPAGPLGGENTCWSLFWIQDYTGSATATLGWFARSYGNMLGYGAIRSGDIPRGALLNPLEAYELDMKMDDGSPVYGDVSVSVENVSPVNSCTTAAGNSTVLNATYNTTYEQPACAMYFLLPQALRGPN